MVEYIVAEERSDPHRPIGEPTRTDFSQMNNYYYLKKIIICFNVANNFMSSEGMKVAPGEEQLIPITGNSVC
jgi:hypothetical protein